MVSGELRIISATIVTGEETGTVRSPVDIVIRNGLIHQVLDSQATGRYGRTNSGSGAEEIDASGRIVIPGLVNAHYHSTGNLFRGMTPTVALEVRMLYNQAQRALLRDDDAYWNALLGAMEMLATGTTACVDHFSGSREAMDGALQAYADVGMRVCFAPMISDKAYRDTLPLSDAELPQSMAWQAPVPAAELVETTVGLIRDWQDKYDRIRIAFGPSGPQRCTDELLKNCARLAIEHDTGVHSHVLETVAQNQAAARLYGMPMIHHLFGMGVLSSRFSMAHAVWLSQDEIDLVAAHGGVAVHNPASNLALGSGFAPVSAFKKCGVPVALGSDSANANGTLNMFDAMRLAGMVHNRPGVDPGDKLTTVEVFRSATSEGARVFCQAGRFGSITPGSRADVVILDPARSPSLTPPNDPLWQVVHANPAGAVETVIVEGQVVLRDGMLTRVREASIRKEALERAERIRSQWVSVKGETDRQAEDLEKALRQYS